MHIELPGLVIERIDNDGEGSDLTARAAIKGVEKQKTAPSLPMIAPIDSQPADQRCRNQRIARQSSRDVLRQVDEPQGGARERIKPADGAIRHDHHERRREMTPRILRDLPLEILIKGFLAADKAAAIMVRAEQIDTGGGGSGATTYKAIAFL